MTRPTLLVDGNNVLVRSVEATRRTAEMTSPDGTSTAALVVFARILSRLVRDAVPFRVLVCWDGGHHRRSALHPDYKANRVHTGQDYKLHSRALAEDFLTAARIPQQRIPGEEADDLIAAHWRHTTGPLLIASNDKDLLQLVGPTPAGGLCVQLRHTDAGTTPTDEHAVAQMLGCSPEQVPLLKALTGDTSDNIDGVPQIGPVRGVKLLAAAGWDLDAITDPRVAERRDLVTRNLALVDLRNTTLDVDPIPPFFPVGPGEPGWKDLVNFCDLHGIREILKSIAHGGTWS